MSVVFFVYVESRLIEGVPVPNIRPQQPVEAAQLPGPMHSHAILPISSQGKISSNRATKLLTKPHRCILKYPRRLNICLPRLKIRMAERQNQSTHPLNFKPIWRARRNQALILDNQFINIRHFNLIHLQKTNSSQCRQTSPPFIIFRQAIIKPCRNSCLQQPYKMRNCGLPTICHTSY